MSLKAHRVPKQPVVLTALRVLLNPRLRGIGLRCVGDIFFHFFFLQYKAALLRHIPVSRVDHPLDSLIPFLPRWVGIYLDFTSLWIRIVGFILTRYRARAEGPLGDFIASMGSLYARAAGVYARRLSTTERPPCLRLRFLLIRLVDPHLMCIPSLHVMVMIRSYTGFAALLRTQGDEAALAPLAEEVRRRALAITEAILYVKQHSVNCVAAAMYAMTRFDPAAFPPAEAENFCLSLLEAPDGIAPGDCGRIRTHILELYRRFLAEGEGAPSWEEPLLRFLSSSPPGSLGTTDN